MNISLYITVLIVHGRFDRTHNVTCIHLYLTMQVRRIGKTEVLMWTWVDLAGFELIIFALDVRALLLRNYDKLSRIFSCILSIRNHMIFLVQFGMNKHLLIF